MPAAVSVLGSRCAASSQAPPRESANTARAAVSKSESAATTIALAVATPVVAQPKAPRRTAPNAHAIAEKSEVNEAPTTAETFAPNGHASLQATSRSAPRSAFLDVHTCHTFQGSPDGF